MQLYTIEGKHLQIAVVPCFYFLKTVMMKQVESL